MKGKRKIGSQERKWSEPAMLTIGQSQKRRDNVFMGPMKQVRISLS